jgi:hypothetical protein
MSTICQKFRIPDVIMISVNLYLTNCNQLPALQGTAATLHDNSKYYY